MLSGHLTVLAKFTERRFKSDGRTEGLFYNVLRKFVIHVLKRHGNSIHISNEHL